MIQRLEMNTALQGRACKHPSLNYQTRLNRSFDDRECKTKSQLRARSIPEHRKSTLFAHWLQISCQRDKASKVQLMYLKMFQQDSRAHNWLPILNQEQKTSLGDTWCTRTSLRATSEQCYIRGRTWIQHQNGFPRDKYYTVPCLSLRTCLQGREERRQMRQLATRSQHHTCDKC